MISLRNSLQSLVRRSFAFDLLPVRDLVPSLEREETWISTGDNPTFELVPREQTRPTGWVYMESNVIRRGAQLVAQLYIDTGSGFLEVESIYIPTTRPGHIKHVFKLPANVCALRWVPMRGKGTIIQKPIRIYEITQVERIGRMVEWVWSDIYKFRKTSQAKQYNLTLSRLVFDLQEAYQDCAKLRLHSPALAYNDFIQAYDTLTEQDCEAIAKHIADFDTKPLISILMPVFNPPLAYLKEAIASIKAQLYQNWELCISDDRSTDPYIAEYLRYISALDSRIKVVFREKNGHISAASNTAIDMARGEFLALVDQDDLIPRHALYHVALEINRHPSANVIYSDEDKIDDAGNRSDPYFKSDWNPDLFFSHNMISHLGVYRTSLLREIGGFRIGYEGSQDYDLALRCIKISQPNQIRHIPRVLYHWRVHHGSTASNPTAKSYAYDAALNALNDFFCDTPGTIVEHGPAIGTYRVRHPLPTTLPKVSLIVPTRDGYTVLRKCVNSILDKTTYQNFEILIVDNGSKDKATVNYLQSISSNSRIKIIRYNAEFNYSAINNYAERYASGEIIGLLNDDTEVIAPDWLDEMVSHVLRPDVGIVGAKLLYTDKHVQHAGVILGIGGFAGHAHRLCAESHPGYAGRAILIQSLSAVTGACMLVKRDVFRRLDGLNEKDLPVAFNDIDFCLRVREAGYRVVWTPYALLYHHESHSRGDDQATAASRSRFTREKSYMLERWRTDTVLDPYYNPNLTLERENFTLAHRPRLSPAWSAYLSTK
ncbi:glycosyltransferase family 2 protein [Burkholderia cenocepacia]|uniref:glycosyltransferase family 2 protein n=1 Tax=Burkholderia cenocepacia TaxID=95486 RepID=UPI0024B63860|nr:glycosyltransferase family 2 protein [Burkholderia cenocepacia]MDI9699082.1 glycosyltransferase family 2 protein [Burkholderia cenocepacia]